MKQKMNPNTVVIERVESCLVFNWKEMRPYTIYPVEFYGIRFGVQKSSITGELELHLVEYPKKIKKFEGIKEVKHSEHIRQNGCKCHKCIGLTKSMKKIIKKMEKKKQ